MAFGLADGVSGTELLFPPPRQETAVTLQRRTEMFNLENTHTYRHGTLFLGRRTGELLSIFYEPLELLIHEDIDDAKINPLETRAASAVCVDGEDSYNSLPALPPYHQIC